MLNDGIQAVRSQDGVVRGRLHLGILQSLGPYIDLPVLLETFRPEYPEVEFAVRSLNTEMIPEQVRSGYVDLSFHALVGESKSTGLKFIPFKQDSLVAISSRKNQRAERRSVSIDVLARERFVSPVSVP
jgi:DNA-binding transcriptional LysR family regulator